MSLEDIFSRQNMAASLNTPIELLAELAEDADESVRVAVAANKNATLEILRKLSGDSSSRVVSEVLANQKTPECLFDEPDFDVIKSLIDAESRGSSLAKHLRDIYVGFDEINARENHKRVESILVEMQGELDEILGDCEEGRQDEAFDEFYANDWHATLFDSNFTPINTLRETYQLIFDELSKSMSESGAFGNSELLEGFVGWQNEMNCWGFLLSPFIPRNVLQSAVWWNPTSNNYMSSLIVSPIMSNRLLHYVTDQIVLKLGSDWIGLALLVNPNSDLYVLDSLCHFGGSAIASAYCEFPTSGAMSIEEIGVCGPLVGKHWFAPIEVFDGWTENDITGPLSEDPPAVLQNLVHVARLYLSTPQGIEEGTREKLSRSELFGNLLVAIRMIDEFKFGRSSVEFEVNSSSALVRSVLYWKPGLDAKTRETIQAKGLAFPEEVGKLLIEGWNRNLSLIY